MRRRLIPRLVLAVFSLFLLITPGQAKAQLEVPGITKCDISAFIDEPGVAAYEECGQLIKTANFCLGTVANGSDNQSVIWNFLTGKGLSPVAVAALMGNMQDESNFSPTARNASSGAYGIVQWLGGRLTGLRAYAQGVGRDPSDLLVQLNFAWQELSGSYKSSVTDPINASGATVESATLTVYNYYEGLKGSGQGSVSNRTNNASAVLSRFGSGTAPTASFSSGCSSSAETSTNIVAAPNCPATGIVYSGQYTEPQLRAIFGPPVRETHANVVSVDFLGQSVEVNKVIAPCLAGVSAELIANNVNYRPEAAKGGFFCLRDNDGQIGDRSYHIYGAACDFNPNTNNYFGDGQPRPFDPNCPPASGAIDSGHCYDMPPQVVSAFEHHGFYWGGNFHSIKDYMHFEFHGVTPP